MRYRTMGKTDLKVSELGLGTSKGLVEKLSAREGERLVSRAIDLGVNFIDTARHYGRGEAETRIGAAIRGRRDRVFLCTKCGTLARGGRDFSRSAILRSCEESLSQLGTDYVDVLMLHMAGPGQLADGSEALETLLQLRQQGKTRFIGASIDGPLMDKAVAVPAFDVVEITYNLADLYPEEGFFDAAARVGMGIVVKEPLAVTNFYRARPHPPWSSYLWERLQQYEFLRDENEMSAVEIALRFVLSSPAIHTAVQATSNMEHLEFNLGLSDGIPLPPALDRMVRDCYRKATARPTGT